MSTIHAVYENGVFRPTDPVNLPEHCSVRIEADTPATDDSRVGDDAITEALNRIYGEGGDSGALDPHFSRAQALTLKKNPAG